MIVAVRPDEHLSPELWRVITTAHNKDFGHWGAKTCRKYLRKFLGRGDITICSITEFIRQCPSYNPFEVIYLDHIGPCENQYTLVLTIIDIVLSYNETANLKQHENFRIHVFVISKPQIWKRKFEAAEAFSHTL